jgi:sigma-B regulation protein RsbU (phosphoserine phosphatase)
MNDPERQPQPAADSGLVGDASVADQAAGALEKTRLDEAVLFRERLLSIVGHDLRSPLQAIRMAAQLIVRKTPDPQTEKLASRIVNSSSRLNDMISQLTDFARVGLGGGLPLDRQEVDLAEVAAQRVDELAVAFPQAVFETVFRGVVVGQWDRQRLAQVFSNLFSNAIHHGEAGKPIRVLVAAEGEAALVEVHNFGRVIPPDQVPSLFSPFRRSMLKMPDATPGPGLGLGLFIASAIVAAHGGTLAVTSTEEHGTTFRARIPPGPAAPPDDSPAQSP